MAPVLARIKKLEAALTELDDDPASDPAGTAQAVTAWEDAGTRPGRLDQDSLFDLEWQSADLQNCGLAGECR